MIIYKIIGLDGFHKYHEFEEFTRQNHWDVIEIAKMLASKEQWEWFKAHPTILTVNEYKEDENTVIVYRFLFGELNTRLSNCTVLETAALSSISSLKLNGGASYSQKRVIKLEATINNTPLTIFWNLKRHSIRVKSEDNCHRDIAWSIAKEVIQANADMNDNQNYRTIKTKKTITYEWIGWHPHPPARYHQVCKYCERAGK